MRNRITAGIVAYASLACACVTGNEGTDTSDDSDVSHTQESLTAGHDGIPSLDCSSWSLANDFHDHIAQRFTSCGNLIFSRTVPGEANFWCEDANVDYSFRLYSFFGPAIWQSNPPKDAGFTVQAYRGTPGTTLQFWGPSGYCNCASDVLCRLPGIRYSR